MAHALVRSAHAVVRLAHSLVRPAALFLTLTLALAPALPAQESWNTPEARAELHALAQADELGNLSGEELARALAETELSGTPLEPELTLLLAASRASEWAALGAVPASEVEVVTAAYRRLLETDERERATRYVLVHLLGLFAREGRPERALELLAEGIDALDEGHVLRPYFFHQLVDLHLATGDVEGAREVAQRAVAEAVESGAGEEVLSALRGMAGVVQLFLGLHDRAAGPIRDDFTYQRGRVERGERLNLGFLLGAHIHQADAYLVTFRFRELLEEVAPALDRAEWFVRAPAARSALAVRVGLAHVGLAFRRDAGDAVAVETRLERAAKLFEEALADPQIGEIDRLRCEVWLAFTAQREGRWSDSLELLESARGRASDGLGPGAREPRWVAVLRLRAARALEAPAEVVASAEDDLRRALADMDAWWRAQPVRRGGLGVLSDPTDRWVLDEAARLELAGAGGAEAALAVLERAREAASLARDLEVEPFDLELARATLLPERGGALVYLPVWFGPTRVFALDRERVETYAAAPLMELLPVLHEFEALVESPPPANAAARRARTETLRGLGTELRDALVPPALQERLAGWDSVTVVGADLLESVGFECLPWGEGWLGAELAVGYLPSFSVGLALARRALADESGGDADGDSGANSGANSGAGTWLVLEPELGDDVRAAHPYLADLALDGDERAALSTVPESWDARVVSGAAATWSAVLEARPARYLHVFTHGVRDPSRERSAGLVLAPEAERAGLVWSEDVELLRAPELVVLAACGSGRGPTRRGDGGASDLGGAFLRAGAGTVVLAPTDLAAEAIVAMMPAFHEGLASGASSAAALTAARARLASSERFADPFYHGLLRAVGLAHRPVFEAEEAPAALSPAVAWLGAGVLLALAVAIARATRARRPAG